MADKVLDNNQLAQLWQKSVNTFMQRADYLKQAYPVGAIYLSVNSTSPALLFGGTWEQIIERFLWADNTAFGSTGGAASHTHSLETDGYAKLSLTDRIIIQDHNASYWQATRSTNNIFSGNLDVDWGMTAGISLGGTTDGSSNMPPYIIVAAWKRIA